MFHVGDRVRLAERLRGRVLEPVGTVVGFADGDVVVRWDTGLEIRLAPWSIRSVEESGPTTNGDGVRVERDAEHPAERGA